MPAEDVHIAHLTQVIGHLKSMTACVIRGYEQAVEELGREGDHRGEDWSAAHKFLRSRLDTFKTGGGDLPTRDDYPR
jgi:hypothetical protein